MKLSERIANTIYTLINKEQKSPFRKAKNNVLNAYGGKCVFCGDTREDFLSIFSPHSKEYKTFVSINKLYLWLKKNKYPEGFIVLCTHCQSHVRHANEKRLNSRDLARS